MAAENPPYAIQADSHGAELFRLAVASLLPRGVFGLTGGQGGIVNSGDLAVTAGTGNSINVAAGSAWVPGNQGAHQGLYYGFNDATVNEAITPNGSNPLVAIVTASVNDQAYSGNPGVTNNQWGLLVTQGTPGSSPAIPTVPNNSLVLATILVPTSAASSAAYTIVPGLGTIVGTTLSAPKGYTSPVTIGEPSGRLGQAATQTLGSTGFQTLNMGSLSWLRGGMTVGGSNASLIVPVAGIYTVKGQVTFGNPSTTVTLSVCINKNGTIASEGSLSVCTATNLVACTVADDILCAAGDILTIAGFNSAGTIPVTFGSTTTTYMSATLVSV